MSQLREIFLREKIKKKPSTTKKKYILKFTNFLYKYNEQISILKLNEIKQN